MAKRTSAYTLPRRSNESCVAGEQKFRFILLYCILAVFFLSV